MLLYGKASGMRVYAWNPICHDTCEEVTACTTYARCGRWHAMRRSPELATPVYICRCLPRPAQMRRSAQMRQTRLVKKRQLRTARENTKPRMLAWTPPGSADSRIIANGGGGTAGGGGVVGGGGTAAERRAQKLQRDILSRNSCRSHATSDVTGRTERVSIW